MNLIGDIIGDMELSFGSPANHSDRDVKTNEPAE